MNEVRRVSATAYRVALLVVALDAIGLGIIMPLVPFMVIHFGGPAALVTQTLAVYSLAAFAGSTMIGRWGDRYGFVRVIVVSLLLSSIATTGLLISWSLASLFFFRTMMGFLTGRLGLVRALAIRGIAREEQPRRMASISAVYSLGVSAGPAIAGVAGLFTHDERTVWTLTLVLSLSVTTLAFAAAAMVFRDDTVARDLAKMARSAPGNSIVAGIRLLRKPLSTVFLINYAQGVALSVTALFVSRMFGWGAAATGWLLAAIAMTMAIARFMVFPPASARLGLHRLLLICVAIGIPAILVIGFSTTPVPFVLATIVLSVAAGLANIVPPTQIAASVPTERSGAAQGLAAAASMLGIFASATISGAIFQFIGTAAPYAVGAVALSGILVIQRTPRRPVPLTRPVEG